MGSVTIINRGKKEIAHKMRFEGLKLKDIALALQVSIATIDRYMQSYDANLESLKKILNP